MESIVVKDVDEAYGIKQKAVKPLTFWRVAFAVFLGNVMTGVLAGLIYAGLR